MYWIPGGLAQIHEAVGEILQHCINTGVRIVLNIDGIQKCDPQCVTNLEGNSAMCIKPGGTVKRSLE